MPFDSTNYQSIDGTLGLLVKARALITDSRRWAKGEYCIGDRYCALGALFGTGAFRDQGDAEQSEAAKLLCRALPSPFAGGFVHRFNDSAVTKHADVLALFDRAIAARLAEQTKVTA